MGAAVAELLNACRSAEKFGVLRSPAPGFSGPTWRRSWRSDAHRRAPSGRRNAQPSSQGIVEHHRQERGDPMPPSGYLTGCGPTCPCTPRGWSLDLRLILGNLRHAHGALAMRVARRTDLWRILGARLGAERSTESAHPALAS